jgi:hypothetical protein
MQPKTCTGNEKETMTATEAKTNNNKKIWIGLGVAVLFCLCSAAFAALILFRMGQKFQQGIKADPKAAAETAHAIADYELPEGYQEEFVMNILTTTMVFISPKTTESRSFEPTIMLAQFKTIGNEEQIKEQMRQSFAQQKGLGNITMKLVAVKKMNIRGQESDVATYEGATESGYTMRQVITTFPGKNGVAILMISGPAEYWKEEAINSFIESIH